GGGATPRGTGRPRGRRAFFLVPRGTRGGTVSPPAEIKAIGRWAHENGVWVVADEIYEHLTYGKREFTSMPGVLPELADTALILNGVAKTYAMTGWRVGWIVGPLDVMKAAINLQSHSTSNVGNV